MAKGKKRKLEARNTGTSHKKTIRPQTKPKKAAPPPKPQPTIPFNPEDRILLVGEGDFSFAKSIVEHHGCYELTATCYDSKEQLFEKYSPQGEAHVKYIEDEGQTVMYGVDATKLAKNAKLRSVAGAGFEIVLFNFPHVGGKSTDVNRQVRFNQELLVSFFECCQTLLAPEGKIVVTLFEGEPYTLWNIRDLARHAGLEVVRSFKFMAEAYPGYSHARTLGNIEGGGGWKGEDRESRSYVFRKKVAMPGGQPGSGKKRKRVGTGDSSDDEG